MFTGKEIQNRWRNLRTCFRRELKKQKHGKSGQAATKRRKYVFFDQLLFLLPTLEDRPTVSECSPTNTNDENSGSEDDSEVVQEKNTYYVDDGPTNIFKAQKSLISGKSKGKKNSNYEESLLNILKEKKEEEIDEDKSFLLSLVPAFKKLTDIQKIDAKMEFLSTLKRFTLPRPNASYNMPLGHNTSTNYGFHRLPENQFSQPNQLGHFNFSSANYSSGSSTPNPVPSGSSHESNTPQIDF